MNKIFCVSCGFKNVYEATKPKFCASCGSSVDGTSVAAHASSHDDDDEVVTVGTNFDLEKMRRGISATNYQNKATKLEEVVGTAEEGEAPLRRRQSNLPDGQDIIKQSINDCAKVTRAKDINE